MICSCRVMAWDGWMEGWMDERTKGQTEKETYGGVGAPNKTYRNKT